jgi:predicted outer membrane protein
MRTQSFLGLATLLSLTLAAAAAWGQDVRTPLDPAVPQQQRESADRQRASHDATTRQGASAQTNEKLVHFFAAKIALMNQAEIEMAKLGASQATDPEVKEFAQSIGRDHQQLTQKLTQAIPKLAMVEGLNGQPFASQSGRPGQLDQRTSQQPGLGQRPTDRPDATQQAGQERRPDAIDRPEAVTDFDRTPAGQRGTTTTIRGQSSDDFTDGAARILLDTCRTATENQVQMATQSLQSKQGKDFDACWVVGQVFAHQMMVAELKALENVGTPEFQQIVQSAGQSAQTHLQHAEQLAERVTSER